MLNNRIAVSILFAVNGFLVANYTARLPLIQSMYNLDDGAIGTSLFFMAMGALIAMPFTGWLIVTNSSRRIASIAGMLFCILIPLISLMPYVWLLNIVFFILGLVTGTMDVSMNAQAVVVEQTYRRSIMSSFHALFSAGMMLGAGSGALFIYLEMGLKPHLLVMSAVSLVLVLWAIQHLVDDHPSADLDASHSFRLPKASLVGVGLIAFCCMLGEGAMEHWSTNYMLHIAQADASFTPLGLVAFSSAMMLSRFFGDWVRNQVNDRLLLICNSLVAILGMTIIVLFPYPISALLGFFLVGSGLSVIVPIAYSTAGNTPGIAPGVGIGMVTTIGYSGFLFGPPIIGFLADWQDLRIALSFVLFLFLVMGVLSFRFKTVHRS